ncbi:uncharacterized protein LOC126994220 [Eriocheir sinensis]|uniref:uncharacterized protein LOC126994220 n=1 Tax=Eriocheir sinensis TaxID=95602 RepID=UPI0021C63EDE|nr:uncharacterized protein LOC126994220 [Eriocheir sinensis]
MAEQLCPLDLSTKPLSGLAMKLPKSAPYNMPKTVIKVSMKSRSHSCEPHSDKINDHRTYLPSQHVEVEVNVEELAPPEASAATLETVYQPEETFLPIEDPKPQEIILNVENSAEVLPCDGLVDVLS